MAFQMIHLETAYRLLERMPKLENTAEYILGAVAPDSVHMSAEFDIRAKVHSHLFEGCGPWGDTKDYDRWVQNIETFYKTHVLNERKQKLRDFALGICVHCLTDYCNDLKLWRHFQRECIPSMGLEGFKEAYYKEAKGIDQWLYKTSGNTNEIRKLLINAEADDFKGYVYKSELEAMRRHLLDVQYATDEVDITRYRYVTKDVLNEFIDTTVDYLVKSLR